jgi:hypothetical protein
MMDAEIRHLARERIARIFRMPLDQIRDDMQFSVDFGRDDPLTSSSTNSTCSTWGIRDIARKLNLKPSWTASLKLELSAIIALTWCYHVLSVRKKWRWFLLGRRFANADDVARDPTLSAHLRPRGRHGLDTVSIGLVTNADSP